MTCVAHAAAPGLIKRDLFSSAILDIMKLTCVFLVGGLSVGIKSNGRARGVRYRPFAAYVDNTEIHREQK